MSKTTHTHKNAKAPAATSAITKPQPELSTIVANEAGAGQGKPEELAPLILHGLDHINRELVVTFCRILERESGCNTPVEELICDLIRMYGWNDVSFEDVEKRFEEFRQLSVCFQEEAIAYIRHNPRLLAKILADGAPEGQ